jgi:hypothetical protein
MLAKTCPSCQLVHPESSLRCECGYDFQTARATRHSGPERHQTPWQQDPLVILGALLFCWPAGFTLLWQSKKLSHSMKWLATFVWFGLAAIALWLRMSDAARPH